MFPVGLDGPGFSFFEWIGVVRFLVVNLKKRKNVFFDF